MCVCACACACACVCKCIMWSVYDIWRTFNVLLVSVDFISWVIEIHLLSLYECTFSDILDLEESINCQGTKKVYTTKYNTFKVFQNNVGLSHFKFLNQRGIIIVQCTYRRLFQNIVHRRLSFFKIYLSKRMFLKMVTKTTLHNVRRKHKSGIIDVGHAIKRGLPNEAWWLASTILRNTVQNSLCVQWLEFKIWT